MNTTGSGPVSEETATHYPPPPSRPALLRWLVQVTRPVLAPLLGSTACRVFGLLVGVVMFAVGAYTVAATGLALAAGSTPRAASGGVWSAAGVMALMAGLSLGKAVLRYGEQFLGHLVAFKALELLRGQIFASLLPRSPRVSLTLRSGDLLARSTKDVDRIEVFFAHTFAPVVAAVLVPLGVVAAIGAAVSWPVAGAVGALLVAEMLVVPLLGAPASRRASRAASGQRARLTQHLTDTVQGMSEVVGYCRSRERLDEMGRIDASMGAALRPVSLWAGLRRGASQLLCLVAPVVVVAMGAGLVREGEVSAAVVAASAAAVLRLTETVRSVEELTAELHTSFAAAERVWQVVHAPVEVGDGVEELVPGVSHEVEWHGVGYAYPGASRPAVEGVSLRARAGQWTCLVGASGSGKSTLAHLALRFDDPQVGRILVDGVDVRELRAESLYREVGLVSQHAHLFRATVADNVRLAAPSASDEEVHAACRAAGIHADIEALPQGYATIVGERGQSLSGGQRQRLALARALLARPSTLVLDEFTSHLDPELDAAVRASVREFLAGATVIEITHRLQWSAQADHVVVLDAGRVVQEGDPAALLETDGPLHILASRGMQHGG